MRRPPILVLPLVLLLLAACGDDEDPLGGASTSDAATTTTTAAPASSTASPTSGPSVTTGRTVVVATSSTIEPPPAPGAPPGTHEEQAIADLAARLGVDPAEITTVSVDEVTWRDGAIGCPEPGMQYTQALVDGVRVVLEVDGTRYQYHAGGARPLFLCTTPEAPAGE